MKIQGRKNQSVGALGPMGIPAPATGAQEPEAAESAQGGDQVSLGASVQVRTLREAVDAMPTVRAEKVEGLRNQIDDGSYHVESEKLARKVVDEILNESLMHRMQGRAAR